MVLVISSIMIFFAVRKRKTVLPQPPETATLTESDITESPVKEDTLSAAEGKTSMGLEPNTAGLLCYLLGWVTGIIFFILEKDNKYVRFHALQSIIVFGILSLAGSIISPIPFLGWVIGVIIGVLSFVLWKNR